MLRLATAPATEPVTLIEAKAHLRVAITDDDTYITTLITAARQVTEQRLNRAIISQTWDLVLDAWPLAEVVIPLGGVSAVSSVKYHNGTSLVTWSSSLYQVAIAGVLGRVMPLSTTTWPIPAYRAECIEIRFVAGYANAGSVPASIKQWLLLQLAHWYEHRETVADAQVYSVPFIDGLLDPYACPVAA